MVLTKGLLGHKTALWKSRKSFFCSFITNVDPIPAVLTIAQQKDRGGHGLAVLPSGTAVPWVSVVVPCGKATLIMNQHVTTFATTSHRNGAFRVILYLCPSALQILCDPKKIGFTGSIFITVFPFNYFLSKNQSLYLSLFMYLYNSELDRKAQKTLLGAVSQSSSSVALNWLIESPPFPLWCLDYGR